MKIVVVIDLYDQLTNGTVMTAYRFVEALKKKGHEVRVVATGAKGDDCYEVPERYLMLVTEVARLQQIRFGKPDFETLVNAFHNADVVHLYLPFKLEKKARKLAKKMRIPCTAAFHLQPENVTYNIGLKRSRLVPKMLYAAYRSRFYKHVNHIHCPSNFIADQLRKHKYKAKLHVISNGVSEEFRPPISGYKEPSTGGGNFNILMIGRYAPEKRQDLLIKAVAMSKYKDRINLVLAGKGPREWHLKHLCRRLKVDNVTFGFYDKDELIKTIHNSDLYVHTADIEIEAIACIEAFSCGVVPVIANSKKSATPQFALDESSLFTAGSAKSLVEKIDYWIENPVKKREMSARYVESAEKYRIEYSIMKTEEMFKFAITDARNDKKFRTKDALRMRRKIVNKSRILNFSSWILYYFIALPLLFFYTTFGMGLKIKGKRNMKKIKKTGAISVSNHVHVIDCAMNALAMSPRRVHFTAMQENFDIPIAGKLLWLLGAMMVPKDHKYVNLFFDEVNTLAKKGRVIHVYPEAHLVNYYGGLREFKRGAFKMACDSQVPILPIVISWRKRKGLWKLILPSKPCATLTVGEPITPDYTLLQRAQEIDLQERTERRMQDMYDKSNKGRSINIFEGRDYSEFHLKDRKAIKSEEEIGELTAPIAPEAITLAATDSYIGNVEIDN